MLSLGYYLCQCCMSFLQQIGMKQNKIKFFSILHIQRILKKINVFTIQLLEKIEGDNQRRTTQLQQHIGHKTQKRKGKNKKKNKQTNKQTNKKKKQYKANQRLSQLNLCRSSFILLCGNLIQNLPWVLPTKFRFIWLLSFRGNFFQKSTNQKQGLPVAAMFVNGSKRNDQSL